MPCISVIMPVYNAEKYLQAAIESILAQDIADFEFIIINDGSSDKSDMIIRSFGDSRIRYFQNTINKGIVFSLNFGIMNSTGEYIARMDSDDISYPSRLRRQFDFLSRNNEYALCGTACEVIDKGGNKKYIIQPPSADQDIKVLLPFVNCFFHPTVMFRRSSVGSEPYKAEYEYCEDHHLWTRISASYRVANIHHPLVKYRIHGKNISMTNRTSMFNVRKLMYDQQFNEMGIRANAHEMDIHHAFLSYDSLYFKYQGYTALNRWLHRLKEECSHSSNKLLTKLLYRRWQTICMRNWRIHSLFFNSLAFENYFMYMEILFGKVRDSLAGRKRVIDF